MNLMSLCRGLTLFLTLITLWVTIFTIRPKQEKINKIKYKYYKIAAQELWIFELLIDNS